MKKKQIKLFTDTHKFVDFEGSQMPKGFAYKLLANDLLTYRDMVLKEHLYNIETLLEKMQEEKKFFTMTEKVMINRIARHLHKEDAGYFRIINVTFGKK